MSKVIGHVKRRKGSFVTVSKAGVVRERSRAEMMKKRKTKAKKR